MKRKSRIKGALAVLALWSAFAVFFMFPTECSAFIFMAVPVAGISLLSLAVYSVFAD